MSSSTLLLVGALTSAVLIAMLAPFLFRETKRVRSLDQQLAVTRKEAAGAAAGEAAGDSAGPDFSLRTLLRPLTLIGSGLVPISTAEREKLRRALRQAGFGRPDALSLFLSYKLGCALIFAGIGVMCAPALSQMVTMVPRGAVIAFAGGAGLVLGGMVPEYVVRSLVKRRTRKMSASLPDALDLMVMCLESGLTFERALATVADELMPIERNLAGELRLIDAELRLGSSRREVLQDYYQRTDVEGLRDLAMSLIQGDRYGTPLTQSMRNIAEAERVRRAARIAAWAARLPVLMSLPMLLMVVPGTMLLVAGPSILSAMEALGSLGDFGGIDSLGGE